MRRWLVGAALAAVLVVPATASAHVERASYWPDPAPDCSVTPCTGGAIPDIRSLASALDRSKPGATHVVCQPDSMDRLKDAIAKARKDGYDIRPHDHRTFSARQAARLLKINQALAKRCRFHEIQPAVNVSGNNDRVVIMPGLYTEPTARSKPTHDPACKQYEITNDKGSSGAVSYTYQLHCPNDQNLIAVMGRAEGPGKDPATPLEDRHGIPNLGPCIRCNFQIEGSGVSADDVVIDAGRVESGNGAPRGPVKDVGIRADRADGFVLRNLTVRHAAEHDIYVLESDGYMLDRFKTFYAGEYGVLTFVEDHGVMQNCEAAGNGDSGLYPGAGAETGNQRKPGTEFRYSQQVRYCDSHHNASGYSGTDGNATWVHHNNFYDNALGFTTDVFTAPGHPGFPQDSDLIEYNNFFDNNFNPYLPGSDVDPSVPVPVGTGLWIAGGNDNVVRYNRFYDNWRRGTMLFGVPDATVCGPVIGTPVTGCDMSKLSTSYRNQFYGNVMGRSPSGEVQPNGVDFWWDAFPGNTGNCWFDNAGATGDAPTTSPDGLPACDNGKDPSMSVGLGNLPNEAELLSCFGAISSGDKKPGGTCPWFDTPAKPGTSRARREQRTQQRAWRALAAEPRVFGHICELYADKRAPACARGATR